MLRRRAGLGVAARGEVQSGEDCLAAGVLIMVVQALGVAAPSAPPASATTVPAGAIVHLELADGLSTIALKRGDHFRVRVATPLVVGGQTLIPAGAPGVGEVIDAQPSDKLGKPAKLMVAIRYVSVGTRQVALKAFKWETRAADDGESFSPTQDGSTIGMKAMFQGAGDIILPVGTPGQAKVAVDVDLSPDGASRQQGTTP